MADWGDLYGSKSPLVDEFHRRMDMAERNERARESAELAAACDRLSKLRQTTAEAPPIRINLGLSTDDPARVIASQRIRLDNCGRADGEWVRAEYHDAEMARMEKVRTEAVARLDALERYAMETRSAVTWGAVSPADEPRVVSGCEACEVELRCAALEEENRRAWTERDAAHAEIERLKSQILPLNHADYARLKERIVQLKADLEREGKMRSAACYQLALADRKRPARHRPGGDVQVGWDPEDY